jgi:predicted enzyme related to lactoylglutathione lyase
VTGHHDPLDALRQPVVPVAPDAAFAARLRARIELAVLNPTGAPMTSTDDQATVTVPPAPTAEGDVVYSSLWLPDVARAEAFYRRALGWRIEPGREPRGRTVGDVTTPMGMWGDVPDATLFLCHAVDDLAAAVLRVRAAGGEAAEPVEEPFGLVAECTDNQGMRFALIESPAADRAPARQAGVGELLYLTVAVPDSGLFREFYGALFGWTCTPGRINDGWGVEGPRPMTGMHGGADHPAVLPMYGVADVAASVAAIRAAGGTATEPERMPYGTTSDCVDDQGARFYVGQV